MMGYQEDVQPKLFYHSMNLEERIPANHLLRQIRSRIDFNFIYEEVKDLYGGRGNVSIPPPAILKMMLLLILYNVRSERELMNTLPMRLDWLWFLDYDLDSEVPNHSVLSKARNRWGVEAFQRFFERIVWQCAEAGLVNGSRLFMDSSLVQADASNNSVIDVNKEALKIHLVKGFRELEARLEEKMEEKENTDDDPTPKTGPANQNYHSTTDPDASVTRQGGGKRNLRYKAHRSVDGKAEVITATEVTPGEVNEAHLLSTLLSMHQANTQTNVETVVADMKYGIADNYLACYDLEVKAHIPDLKKSHNHFQGIFHEEDFQYQPEIDAYRCPSGNHLKRSSYKPERDTYEYRCSRKVCRSCSFVTQCTKSKNGRTLHRHRRQEDLDKMRSTAQSTTAQQDIRTRQHLMERSFARATRYGFKRARWRRLWRVQIQEFLISAIQNIMVLLSHSKDRKLAKECSLAFVQKLSSDLRFLFVRIQNVILCFNNNLFLDMERGIQHR
jgi:transposase